MLQLCSRFERVIGGESKGRQERIVGKRCTWRHFAEDVDVSGGCLDLSNLVQCHPADADPFSRMRMLQKCVYGISDHVTSVRQEQTL